MTETTTTTQRVYTQEECLRHAKWFVNAYQNELAADVKNGWHHETFGEWKKENPTHKLASKPYPDNAFVEVISEYIRYFDLVYDNPKAEKMSDAIKLDF